MNEVHMAEVNQSLIVVSVNSLLNRQWKVPMVVPCTTRTVNARYIDPTTVESWFCWTWLAYHMKPLGIVSQELLFLALVPLVNDAHEKIFCQLIINGSVSIRDYMNDLTFNDNLNEVDNTRQSNAVSQCHGLQDRHDTSDAIVAQYTIINSSDDQNTVPIDMYQTHDARSGPLHVPGQSFQPIILFRNFTSRLRKTKLLRTFVTRTSTSLESSCKCSSCKERLDFLPFNYSMGEVVLCSK